MDYLTSHVIASVEFMNVCATPWTRAGAFVDQIERSLLVGSSLFKDTSLVLRTRLPLVKGDLANKTVASFAHAAGENVAIVFGEVGSYVPSQHFGRNRL